MVRGWLAAAVALLGLFCILMLKIERVRLGQALSGSPAPWIMAALAAPVVAVALVQLLHHEFVARYFDGPMRLLLGGFILAYFMHRRINVLAHAQYALPLSVFLCAATLLYPGASAHFWQGGRVASYFMDPITLAQHTMIVGFMCMFLVDAHGTDTRSLRVLKYAAFITALAVALWTQSRTAWLMVPILSTIWLVGYRRKQGLPALLMSLVLVGGACAALFYFSSVVQLRVDMAVDEIVAYFAGQRDTSVGVRISLLRANWALFVLSPGYGWGFEHLPDLSRIPDIETYRTPLFEHYFTKSGSHSEFMQAMMRMGSIGLASRLLLLLVPLAVFARASQAHNARQRAAGYVGLTVVVGYLSASFTSEVFNLIYTASFYSLTVAAFGAAAISKDTP